jgi:hypothetical protein
MIDADTAGIIGARILEYAGYITLLVGMFILGVYFIAMFHCILNTPEPGWEWECAGDTTAETFNAYLRALPWNDSENPALPSVL